MNLVTSPSELLEHQFALLQVDPNTGTPMNESGWVMSGEERYLAFDTEADAREHAAAQLRDNPLFEYALIDSNGLNVDVLHNRTALLLNAERQKKKSKKKGIWLACSELIRRIWR